jgi:hypothetical protein
MSNQVQASPVGQALLEDANSKWARRRQRQIPRSVWLAGIVPLPAQAAAIAILALYPPPYFDHARRGGSKTTAIRRARKRQTQTKTSIPRPFIKPPLERPNKSEELRQLEAELEKLTPNTIKKCARKDKPEQAGARQEKMLAAEERLKKREQEMAEKFQRLKSKWTN